MTQFRAQAIKGFDRQPLIDHAQEFRNTQVVVIHFSQEFADQRVQHPFHRGQQHTHRYHSAQINFGPQWYCQRTRQRNGKRSPSSAITLSLFAASQKG